MTTPKQSLYSKLSKYKKTLKGIHESDMWKGFKEQYELEQSGMGEDIFAFQKHQKEAFSTIMESFNLHNGEADYNKKFILRYYEIDVETGRDPMKGKRMNSLTERLIYYWANPWKVAEEIIGKRQLEKCNPHVAFSGFNKTQKLILRDLMDPSFLNVGFTAGRGCAKTFLVGLDGAISQYLIPHCEHMIVSGSEDQARAAFKYFRMIMVGSPLEMIVKDEIRKTRMESISDGYFQAFASSSTAVQSPRTNKLIFDECAGIKEDVMEYALGTFAGRTFNKLMECGTPNSMLHQYYKDFQMWEGQMELSPSEYLNIPEFERWRWHTLSHYDCKWVTEQTTNMYIQKYGRASHQYKIMVMGAFSPASGTVFDQDKLAVSLINTLPTILDVEYKDDKGILQYKKEDAQYGLYSVGFDCGYTPEHPTVFIKACLGQDGHVYVVDEIAPPRNTDAITQTLKSFALKDMATILADSGAVATGINRRMPSMVGQFGLDYKVISFQKFKMDMVTNCMGMFEQEIIHIDRNKCFKLKKELEIYAWDENAQEDKPKKGGDDYVDAFLLACWGHRNALLDRAYRPEGSNEPMNLEDHLEPVNTDANDNMDMYTNIYR